MVPPITNKDKNTFLLENFFIRWQKKNDWEKTEHVNYANT